MAREGNILNPTKVTLYMPRDTIKRGKRYAASKGRSLSQMVTNLVEKEVGEETPVTIQFNKKSWKKIRAKADELDLTVEQYVQTKVTNEDSGN